VGVEGIDTRATEWSIGKMMYKRGDLVFVHTLDVADIEHGQTKGIYKLNQNVTNTDYVIKAKTLDGRDAYFYSHQVCPATKNTCRFYGIKL
jgi:hypothetical protein